MERPPSLAVPPTPGAGLEVDILVAYFLVGGDFLDARITLFFLSETTGNLEDDYVSQVLLLRLIVYVGTLGGMGE